MPDMTYSDSAASIRNNAWFRSRVDVATSKYSNYLLNTPTTDADFEAKTAYGTRIAQSSGMIIDSLMFTLSGDAEILAAGPAVPDATLQSICEKTIVKIYPPATPSATMAFSGAAIPAIDASLWTSVPMTKQ